MNLTKFRQQHNDIMQNVTELRELMNANIKENAEDIVKTIASMSTIIKDHLSIEDESLYPLFQSTKNIKLRILASKYQEEMGGLATVYINFVTQWDTANNIANNPEAFRQQADVVFNALHERIQRENSELYPLAESL